MPASRMTVFKPSCSRTVIMVTAGNAVAVETAMRHRRRLPRTPRRRLHRSVVGTV